MLVLANQVRLHDTDSAGILYFAALFRFVHEAFEDFATHLGYPLPQLIQESPWLFVIRHVEADYLFPLRFGDKISITVEVESIGNTSLIIRYSVSVTSTGQLAAKARSVHVAIDRASGLKRELPEDLKDWKIIN